MPESLQLVAIQVQMQGLVQKQGFYGVGLGTSDLAGQKGLVSWNGLKENFACSHGSH